MANTNCAFQTIREIRSASPEELITYLHSWGNVVRESDSLEDIRRAAITNYEFEGAGLGSVKDEYFRVTNHLPQYQH